MNVSQLGPLKRTAHHFRHHCDIFTRCVHHQQPSRPPTIHPIMGLFTFYTFDNITWVARRSNQPTLPSKNSIHSTSQGWFMDGVHKIMFPTPVGKASLKLFCEWLKRIVMQIRCAEFVFEAFGNNKKRLVCFD